MTISTTIPLLLITTNIEDLSLSLLVKKMLSGLSRKNPFLLDPLSGLSLEMYPTIPMEKHPVPIVKPESQVLLNMPTILMALIEKFNQLEAENCTSMIEPRDVTPTPKRSPIPRVITKRSKRRV